MVKYSNKDAVVKVNGSEIYCESADIGYHGAPEPEFNIRSKHTSRHVAMSPLGGSLSLTYFLIGEDPIADFVNERTPFLIDFGGLEIGSAYLVSYDLSLAPFGSLKVTVTFSFFEELEGEITPTFSALPDDVSILNVSDVSIEGGVVVEEGKLIDLGYNYECNIEPSFVLDEANNKAELRNIVTTPQKQKVNLKIYDLNFDLEEKGAQESFKINLNDKNGNTQQVFNIEAVIRSKTTELRALGGAVVTELELGQANLSHAPGEGPSITSITPIEGLVGSVVRLEGNNFVNVERVLLGEFPCELAGDYTSTVLDFYVSKDIYSGYNAPVRLITRGSETIAPYTYETKNGLTF